MPATPFDSTHLHQLFPTGETARLFSDTTEIRAMMLVEGTLAQVQASHGVIPEISAAAIHRAGLEIQIDPGRLAGETGTNGVCTPALVAAFRDAMQAPEHAQFLHWGATSQDIQDTALMLRLRQALGQMETHLDEILGNLAKLAQTHAESAMAGRSFGQLATPTSFGAVVANWGWPLLEARRALPRLRETSLFVSLSGAVGTGSALGPDPAAIRRDLAARLALGDPGRCWHSDRGPILRIADWMTRTGLALGKLAQDLVLHSQSGVEEVKIGSAGASSTMPQKQNPVAASAVVALAAHLRGLNATLQGAGVHAQQRDGAAWFTEWFTEWLTLPQLVLSSAAALTHGARMTETLMPDTDRMRANLEAGGGLAYAEALSFALASHTPRTEAKQAVAAMCREARETGTELETLARQAHPDLAQDLFVPQTHLGQAPAEARAFAAAVEACAREESA